MEHTSYHFDVFISYNSSDKHVADAVCHYLEERKLKCFIASRNITPPDWAGSITRAIEHSKAFVVIISRRSILSNEVAKEITLATRVSNYIFPFRVDDVEMDDRMSYHLSAFHWIDAITPPMEQRILELTDRIRASLESEDANYGDAVLNSSQNRSKQRLLGQNIRPRAEFIGRDRELAEIEERFESGAGCVFVSGMGGIGKSEIARAFAKKYSDIYTTVVFANYETDLLHLIASDQAIPVENLTQALASGGQAETLQAYYKRKMQVLRAIVDEHTLLIIDNFDVEYDDCLEEVMTLPCRILWTTRTDFSSFGYETVPIGALDHFDDLIRLYEKIDRHYADEAEDSAVEKIIRLLDCHTYAVSLTAAQVKAGHMKPTGMLEQLQSEGLKIHTRSGFARNITDRKKMTAFEYIEMLFDFGKLSNRSCHIMRLMACTPREGMDIDLFMECAEIEDFSEISDLAALNWIQMDEENDRIGLHMLVREMVMKKLSPTISNCMPLLLGINERVCNAWNQTYEDNSKMEPIVYSILDVFKNATQETFDIFENCATFCWIQGNFELSESYEHKLYKLACDTYGNISVEAGKAALRVAAVYHNQGNYPAAKPWYEKGLEIQLAIDPQSRETAAALEKVGRCHAQNGELEAALDKFIRAKAIFERILEEGLSGNDAEKVRKANVNLAFEKHHIAHVYAMEGRGSEGLQYALESYEYLKTEKMEPSLVIYSMMVLVYVYYDMHMYDEAARYADLAVKESLYYRGEKCIDMLFLYEMQGDARFREEKYDEARAAYAKALGGREKYFPADQEALDRLEKKYICTGEHKDAGYPLLEIWT